ncbi:MAG: mycofactocin glycosyltransferase [Pseudonocardiales bacterium]|nr:mycofactocin glycosyltransferase [Pseudonocardiales bacterium]
MTAIPAAFGIAVDRDTKQLDDRTLWGGSPARVLRLSALGAAAWRELGAAGVRSPASGVLARRLTDAGLAHPRPPEIDTDFDVTVLIPVRDRADALDRCLSALGHAHRVIVVDDGSADGPAVAQVAHRHGATVVRRARNGGPAAARNSGLFDVRAEFVALLDSDCVPTPDWIAQLAPHFADPLVAAVAPRVVALVDGPSRVARFGARFGSLDLGTREARVAPGTRVAYVPTAALVVRRAALDQIARDGAVFDDAMRVGEDVDLVWRLHDAGWRIRFDPSAIVRHDEPTSWAALLARRYRYGTSAGPLAVRHPASMAPVVLSALPVATAVSVLARRPLFAAASFAASVLTTARTLRIAELPTTGVVPACASAVRDTWLGIGRYACQFAAPALVAGCAIGGRRRWGRRAALTGLLLAPAFAPSRGSGRVDAATRVVGRLLDDVAYGAGVWVGCVRARTTVPLRPDVRLRPLRRLPRDRHRCAAPGHSMPVTMARRDSS